MKEYLWVVYLVIGYLAGWAVSVAYFRAKARAKEAQLAGEVRELLDEIGIVEVPEFGPIPAGQLEALGVCSYCLAVPGNTPECPRCGDALADALKWERPKVIDTIPVREGQSIQEAIDSHNFQINGNGKIPFHGVKL